MDHQASRISYTALLRTCVRGRIRGRTRKLANANAELLVDWSTSRILQLLRPSPVVCHLQLCLNCHALIAGEDGCRTVPPAVPPDADRLQSEGLVAGIGGDDAEAHDDATEHAAASPAVRRCPCRIACYLHRNRIFPSVRAGSGFQTHLCLLFVRPLIRYHQNATPHGTAAPPHHTQPHNHTSARAQRHATC